MSRDKQYFVTYGLKRCLQEAYANSSLAERANIQSRTEKIINHYRQETRKVPMRDRPGREHQQVDEKIAKLGLPALSTCKKGCAACCHINVQVTNSEAQELAGLVRSGEVPVDMKLLREQAAFTGDDYAYATQPREKSRCVFLGTDNTCRAYEKRPSNCRKYLVRSDPKHCEMLDDTPEILSSIELEAMVSGFADLDQNFDPLPKSLLRFLE